MLDLCVMVGYVVGTITSGREVMDIMDQIKFEDYMGWHKWMKRIPCIPVKEGWSIKPLPPFGGAVARFRVELPSGESKSIYLDCYDRLGCVGEPYWEVFPVGGDVGRCLMDEVDQLVNLIEAD